MEEKYIKFYSKFNRRWRKLIRHPKTLRDGRVEKNGALKEENNGRNRWVGLGFWNYRSHSISSTRKTYKDFETKGNSRRGLQRRVMHQTNLLNHG